MKSFPSYSHGAAEEKRMELGLKAFLNLGTLSGIQIKVW